MITNTEIEFGIDLINEVYDQYIIYIDSISYTDVDEKEYTTSNTLLENVKKSTYSSVQYLQELKRESLTQYEIILKQDTTIFNLCFEIYGIVNDENFALIIKANDLEAYNRTDINPYSPIIKKGTKIIYYK